MTRLAILGATGAVGTTLLRVLEERAFPLDELRLLASERSAGTQIRFGGRELTVQAVGPGSFDGHRHRDLLGRRDALARVGAAGHRGRRRRRRQLLGLPHGRGRSARRGRRQPARRARARGPDRQPELLDDAAHARARGPAPPLAARARHRRDLPVGLGHRAEGDRRAARGVGGGARRRGAARRRLRAPHRVQRAALRRLASRATTATPTRSSSSSTSRARSSSCPTCASARPACACRS